MLPFLVAMQVAPAPPSDVAQPPPAAPSSPAAPPAPTSSQPPSDVAQPPPAAPSSPAASPAPAAPAPPAPPATPSEAPPSDVPPAPAADPAAVPLSPPSGPPILASDAPIRWYLRGAVGFGPPAFSDQVDVLSLEGYGGVKLWAAVDGGYFAHPNVGVGGLVAFSRWTSAPVPTHALEENALFVCIGAPVRVGSRLISFVGAPRLGLAVGKQTLGGEAPSQTAFAWGLDVSAVSFRYHLSVTAGLLFAGVGPPGELGRNHNLGGAWLALGGTHGHE